MMEEIDIAERSAQAGLVAPGTAVPTAVTPPGTRPPWGLTVILATAGVGAFCVAVGATDLLPYSGVVTHFGAFLIVYPAMIGVTWLPPSVLSRPVDAFLDKWVTDTGKGFYSVMALTVLMVLEAQQVTAWLAHPDVSVAAVAAYVDRSWWQWLTGFSLDRIKNFVWAVAWPGHFFGKYPAGVVLVFGAAAWMVHAAGAKCFPGTPRIEVTEADRQRAKAKKAAKREAKSAARAARRSGHGL